MFRFYQDKRCQTQRDLEWLLYNSRMYQNASPILSSEHHRKSTDSVYINQMSNKNNLQIKIKKEWNAISPEYYFVELMKNEAIHYGKLLRYK